METYIINSGNVSAALSELKKGGKHFIITVDVPFPGGTVELGAEVSLLSGAVRLPPAQVQQLN